jgi:hypothetical protein
VTVPDYDPKTRAESLAAHAQPRRVYLCGGINGLSDAYARDWRAVASAALLRAGFIVLDPMRRDFRGREAENVRAIVQGDLFDIGASDVLMVNASRPSWGTAMEVAIAARHQGHRKQIFAFGAGEAPSPWLVYHCDQLFPDLAAALAHILTTAQPQAGSSAASSCATSAASDSVS